MAIIKAIDFRVYDRYNIQRNPRLSHNKKDSMSTAICRVHYNNHRQKRATKKANIQSIINTYNIQKGYMITATLNVC